MIIDKIGKQGKKHTREPQRFATFSFQLFPNEIYDIFFPLYEHELELENLFFNRESMTFFSLHMNMNFKMYSAIGKLIRGCQHALPRNSSNGQQERPFIGPLAKIKEQHKRVQGQWIEIIRIIKRLCSIFFLQVINHQVSSPAESQIDLSQEVWIMEAQYSETIMNMGDNNKGTSGFQYIRHQISIQMTITFMLVYDPSEM